MKDEIMGLIKKAMLSKNKIELESLRAIKTKFTEHTNAKNATELTEAEEIRILNKMVKERIETAEIYTENNRPELAEKELAEAEVIKQYLPKEVSKEAIEKFVKTLLPIDQKGMGNAIKSVKVKYPAADGKIVSEIVRANLTV